MGERPAATPAVQLCSACTKSSIGLRASRPPGTPTAKKASSTSAAVGELVGGCGHTRGQRGAVGGQAVGQLQQLGVALHHTQGALQQRLPLLVVEQALEVGQLPRQQHALGEAQRVDGLDLHGAVCSPGRPARGGR